ncbi:outer membrane beta-barrel protein [Flavobacterium sp. 123]|uniref:outer membrane beta-barrel protein n=1 Tax=Flavobacterium sp. 123 TaxID=2135627 RepID=UPI000EB42B49|nr:outer membrane beta-barrel protein [Flavobacterium sp. 123]RKS99326.1 outer membrane protein with beta-barrel domain [Flavobacterium sp. 123]
MKKIILLATVCFMSIGAFAQAPLENGALQLNAGLGSSGWGTPIYVGLDYGVGNNFTVGGELSYQSKSATYASTKYKSTAIGIGANGNYHFNALLDIPSKWDLYAGLGINYYVWKYDNELYKTSDNSNIGLGAQIGGRYFFSDKFGVNLEVGGGSATSGAKIGVTYKL